jgi:chemotaxis protein methyltransferase CheR
MAISSHDFKFLQDTLIRIASIRLENEKKDLAETRLGRMCAKEGIPSIADFFTKLRSDKMGSLERKLIEAMTTHETYFFRDIHPFDAIKTKIIPELMANRKKERTLRLWSAACSTGQEAYSLAMLIQESFPELVSWKVEILGTDLCAETITKAETGFYSGFETARGLPEAFQSRYFEIQEKGWRLRQNIRNKVYFRKMNLLENWPLVGRYDIICLRNVLIYFDDPDKKKILKQLSHFLQPDGYLILGTSETTLNLDAGYREELIDNSKVYRTGN